MSEVLEQSEEVDWVRGENRSKVQELFNGDPPLDLAESERLHMKVNTNFGEGPVLAAHALRLYTNTFLTRNRYYRIFIPDAPQEHQASWSWFITNWINRDLKRDRAFYYLHRNRWTTVVAHGIAPQIWLLS